MRKFRDRLHKKAIKSGSTDSWLVYKQARNKSTSLIKRSKSMYLTKLAGDTSSNSNSKSRDALWRKLSFVTE